MGENNTNENELRGVQEQDCGPTESSARGQSSSHLVWKIVGGVALGLAATTLIASLNDIRRYIRISRM